MNKYKLGNCSVLKTAWGKHIILLISHLPYYDSFWNDLGPLSRNELPWWLYSHWGARFYTSHQCRGVSESAPVLASVRFKAIGESRCFEKITFYVLMLLMFAFAASFCIWKPQILTTAIEGFKMSFYFPLTSLFPSTTRVMCLSCAFQWRKVLL